MLANNLKFCQDQRSHFCSEKLAGMNPDDDPMIQFETTTEKPQTCVVSEGLLFLVFRHLSEIRMCQFFLALYSASDLSCVSAWSVVSELLHAFALGRICVCNPGYNLALGVLLL